MKILFKITLAILILTSCETYRRSKCVKEWVDPQLNVRYMVYKYSYYYRRNDSVYCMMIDTVKVNLNHREEPKPIVREGRKLNMDEYGK